MENITPSELAGFGVGTFLLCATIAAPKVDAFISASQRSSLGMCKKCGNLRMIACAKCKGVGLIREGSLFGISLGDESKVRSTACVNCQGKGQFSCPECSKSSA
ncbi:uncharacterized protein LOC133817844 isoform X1 [Humulus lupulus]|uniref:uncharacterized protein LOC133817844 isoform X1 n=1 Tax=Humulus lupulus TaxID=3486 RepID=UPI002B4040B7|nr:uncharacterized protein LOC133817844 isoform X1 [Humulus lupulus]